MKAVLIITFGFALFAAWLSSRRRRENFSRLQQHEVFQQPRKERN